MWTVFFCITGSLFLTLAACTSTGPKEEEIFICEALCYHTTKRGSLERIEIHGSEKSKSSAWKEMQAICQKITCPNCRAELQKPNPPTKIDGQLEYSLRQATADKDCTLVRY